MSVGEQLARAREQRGLSIDDVSARTRIRATLIRAIESDEFEPCGGAVYARGHIRSMARVVGLDPEPLIAAYDEEQGAPSPAPAVPAYDPDTPAATERRRPNWSAAMAVALVALIVIGVVQLLGRGGSGHHGSSGSPQAGKAPAATASPTPTPSRSTAPATPPPSAVAQLPANGVTVRVAVRSAQTWLSVTGAGNQALFQGLLAAGEQKVFRDPHKLQLVIGNAPAVDLVVNGKDIGSPPAQGNVARVAFTPSDPAAAG